MPVQFLTPEQRAHYATKGVRRVRQCPHVERNIVAIHDEVNRAG